MIDIDWTLFMQIANFLLLVFLLNMVLFRPIRGTLKERQNLFSGLQSDVSSLTETEQGVRQDIQSELLAARKSGINKRDMLKQEGSAMEAGMMEKAKTEADDEMARMAAKIKSDVAAAREALSPQAQSFALDLAAKILGREVA
jgi:F-type H+-transporting ATPase subunit b